MSKLVDIVDDSLTDKNTTHSYLETYENLLSSKKYTASNVYEIGIGPGDRNGGSILMWHDYFLSANIYASDMLPYDQMNPNITNKERIHIYTSTDAYNPTFVNTAFKTNNITFDVVVDDGPHTLESMIMCIQQYLPLLKEDGIMIIEDVQSIHWLPILQNMVPEELKPYIETYDLRGNKGRYDDIVFVINRSKKL